MKVTYWLSVCQDDHPAYNIRRKTKKEVLAALHARYTNWRETDARYLSKYSEPIKLTVEYDDGLDLVRVALEGYIAEPLQFDLPNWDYKKFVK